MGCLRFRSRYGRAGVSRRNVLFAESLWYGYGRLGWREFFNALVFFAVFGLPGVAYAVCTRFGFWRKSVDVLAGADSPNRLQQPGNAGCKRSRSGSFEVYRRQ